MSSTQKRRSEWDTRIHDYTESHTATRRCSHTKLLACSTIVLHIFSCLLDRISFPMEREHSTIDASAVLFHTFEGCTMPHNHVLSQEATSTQDLEEM